MSFSGKEIGFSVVLFIAYIIQIVTGFGSGILTMPFGMMLVGREIVVSELNFFGCIISMYFAWFERDNIVWRVVIESAIVVALGALFGMFLEPLLNSVWLYKVYGVFIFGLAIYMLFRRKVQDLHKAKYILMFFAGVLHFLFASGGPLMVIAVIGQINDKLKFHATINAIWIPISIITFISHAKLGYFSNYYFKLWVLLIPALIMGMIVGYFLYKKVDTKLFMKLAYCSLAIMGLFVIIL